MLPRIAADRRANEPVSGNPAVPRLAALSKRPRVGEATRSGPEIFTKPEHARANPRRPGVLRGGAPGQTRSEKAFHPF
jgi:hypothetical protein